MPIEPSQRQMEEIQAVAGGPGDGPLVMLNLNRYSNPEAYARYGAVATRVLERVGGKVLWHAAVDGLVIGEDGDTYDDVIAVWYPSAAAFVELATDPELLGARDHRLDGLERASILRCAGAAEPVLPAGV